MPVVFKTFNFFVRFFFTFLFYTQLHFIIFTIRNVFVIGFNVKYYSEFISVSLKLSHELMNNKIYKYYIKLVRKLLTKYSLTGTQGAGEPPHNVMRKLLLFF